MICRLSELCGKEVVNLTDGTILGSIGDLDIDSGCAGILALVIPGRAKCFGLLGHEEELVIPWDKIRVIGRDAILVCLDQCRPGRPPKTGLFGLLGRLFSK